MPKKTDSTVERLKENLRQNPNDVPSAFGLAQRLKELKKFKTALEYLDALLLEDPEHKGAQALRTEIEETRASAKAKIKMLTSSAQKSFATTHAETAAAETKDTEKDITTTPPPPPYPNEAAAEEEKETELSGEFEEWELV